MVILRMKLARLLQFIRLVRPMLSLMRHIQLVHPLAVIRLLLLLRSMKHTRPARLLQAIRRLLRRRPRPVAIHPRPVPLNLLKHIRLVHLPAAIRLLLPLPLLIQLQVYRQPLVLVVVDIQ